MSAPPRPPRPGWRRPAAPRPVGTASPPTPPASRADLGARTAAVLKDSTPIAVSLVSLMLSLYSIVAANREPEIDLSLPEIVRITQGPFDSWLYLQPRFVSTGRNDRVAVVSELRVRLEPETGEPIPFVWDEQGTWRYDPERPEDGLTWVYTADPAPLVVGPSNPALPIGLFVGPPDWPWTPGTYRIVVEAEQNTTGKTLTASTRITITPDVVEVLMGGVGKSIWDLPTDD